MSKCPHCGESKIITKRGPSRYACGYYRNGSEVGECVNHQSMSTPSTCRPRVRITYSESLGVEDVRVMISPRTPDCETYDELGGILQVHADEKSGQVCGLRINCQKLNGKAAEDKLLDLLAAIAQSADTDHRGGLNAKAQRILKECGELIGQDRVKAKNEALTAEKVALWGNLHPLIDQTCTVSDYAGVRDKLTKFIRDMEDQSQRYAHLDELFRELADRYRIHDSLRGRSNGILNNVLLALKDKDIFAYWEHLARSGNLDYLYWTCVANCVTHKAYDQQYKAYETAFKILLERDIKEDQIENMVKIKHYLLNLMEPILEDSGDFGKAIAFLTHIAEVDPHESKVLAKDIVNQFKDHGDDGLIEEDFFDDDDDN